MKKLIFSLFLFFTLLFFHSFSHSLALYDFSKNQKIFLKEIKVEGLQNMTFEEFLKVAQIKPDSYFFIFELEKTILSLISSGFFLDISYNISLLQEGYQISFQLEENLPLASLKVIDGKMLDLSLLQVKLEEEGIVTGKVFSSLQLEKALDQFMMHNQSYGVFLYTLSFKEISKKEIEEVGGEFLFTKEEKEKDGVHALIHIHNLSQITITDIKMVDTTIYFDEVLNYIQLSKGVVIQEDNDLFFRYKRLKRLGFYESVFFKILPDLNNPGGHKIIIQTKQIETNPITTTLVAPPNIGIVTVLEYYNISLFNSLQRLKISGGWQLSLGSPIFSIEYTHPYFWKGLFFSANLSKNDSIDLIKDSGNQKLTQDYDFKLTTGANLYGNLFAYFFHKETYFISETVDEKYKSLSDYEKTKGFRHSSGLVFLYDNLDDSFFINQGFRISIDNELFWKKNLAYKAGFNGELYLPIPVMESVIAFVNKTEILVTHKEDKDTSLSLNPRMRTNVQEIFNINNQQIKFTLYGSAEIRFALTQIENLIKDLSFVVFIEAGGAWEDYSFISLKNTLYGFGLGLRLSPRKHYSDFLFQFPAGVYIGYRIGEDKVKPSLISHRDSLYYIHLTASF